MSGEEAQGLAKLRSNFLGGGSEAEGGTSQDPKGVPLHFRAARPLAASAACESLWGKIVRPYIVGIIEPPPALPPVIA